MYIGSDAIALAPFTDTVSYLEDGDCAVVHRSSAEIHDAKGKTVHRDVLKSQASVMLIDKGNHRHFMAKEIHEQPEVVGHTLAHYLDMVAGRVALPMALPFDFRALKRVSIAACGTAYYAGMVARYWFERFAHLPVEVDIASEFRYREVPLDPGRSPSSFRSRGRPPIRLPRSGMRAITRSTFSPSSMCRPRRLPAKAMW